MMLDSSLYILIFSGVRTQAGFLLCSCGMETGHNAVVSEARTVLDMSEHSHTAVLSMGVEEGRVFDPAI